MSTTIHLGYEVGTGEPIEIPLRHTAVTGQTQESGKTTTLEGLIARSALKAVAYVTKRGESSFRVMHPIPPYFLERADWKFVQSLLEAAMESKMDFKQAWIMRASDGAKTLEDVRANIRKFLHGVKDPAPAPKVKRGKEVKERWISKPARGLNADVYYVLDKYFEEIMPQLDRMPYSKKLDLAGGLNVMDLRDYEFPLQALVVRSVIDWVHDHGENTINVIPEAWKFAPKQKGSPVRQSAEEMIREGAAMKNFLWIDSQDLAGVADVLMRQVGVWLFGVQRAKHEIERALDHMPEGLPVRRPRPQDIATLSKGQFYVCFGREMHKVYVQPAWMKAAHAEAIARGEEEVDTAREILEEFDKESENYGTDRHTHVAPVAAAFVGEKVTEDSENSKTVSVSGMRRQNVETGASDPASDRGTQRSDDSAAIETSEEAMWKEKFEALKAELAAQRARYVELEEKYHDMVASGIYPDPDRPTPANGSGAPADLDRVYAYIKDRASKDPGILQLLTQKPELRVKVERVTIEADSKTLRGRLALLISKKFFETPQNGNTAFNELKRQGVACAKPNVYRELDKLAELGFVTKEENGYQVVAGMRVHIQGEA